MTRTDAVGVGEAMALLDPETDGPLERVRTFRLRMAGAEANVCISLARLGFRSAFVSAVGTDPFGKFVRETLEGQGVDVTAVTRLVGKRTGVFFKERLDDRARRVYYYRDGSAASQLGPEAVDRILELRPTVLVVSGLSLGLGGDDGLAGLCRLAVRRVREQGGAVVFDANLREGLWDAHQAAADFRALRPHIDVLLAGRSELARLTPGKAPGEAARALCAAGMRGVIVKEGARGSTVVDATGSQRIEAVPSPVVADPVGAGDAFAAGVVVGILEGWPLADGARLGAVLGSAAVARTGDWEGTPTGEEARALLASMVGAPASGAGTE